MSRTTFSGPVASLNGFLNVSDNDKTVAITAPASLAASYTLTLPPNDGNSGQFLSTNGSGVLSWTAGDGTGTVTSVGGTGTVNGLTLTGTVTTTGSLTLGGTLDLSSPPAIGGTAPNTGAFTSLALTNTSASTGLYEPMAVASTLTGAGVTGGRSKFDTTINSAAGSFTNALKANVSYGASGKTTGLGSAFVAELSLSAGTVDGNYAPLELELNLGAGAATGTQTALMYASVNGADASSMDTAGVFMNLQGLTAGAAGSTDLVTAPGASFVANDLLTGVGIKIKIGSNFYYIPLVAAADYQDN